MGSLLTECSVVDRMVFLFGGGRLDAEVDLIDASENAVALAHGHAGGTEQNFSTEAVDGALFGILDGGDATPLRVVVLGEQDSDPFEESTTRGAGAGNVVIDELIDINVDVHADNPGELNGVQWHRSGALRRALRVARACEALLLRYPRLDVPAPDSLTGIVATIDVQGIERLDVNSESPENSTIRISTRARLRGNRG